MLSAQEELDRFLDRKSSLFERALLNWLAAKFQRHGDETQAIHDLAKLIRDTLVLSDLHGRRRTLLEADHLGRMERKAKFAELPDRNPIMYGVPFIEAIDDLLTREPRLASGWVETADLYNQEHVFALARSASMRLTKRVMDAVGRMMSEGQLAGKTEDEILKAAADESHDWTRSYSATIFRTNVSHAYNQGRFQQARDPDVRQVIKALEVVGVPDDRERENHRYARGLIADVQDPVWSRAKPPYGFNCRHGTIFVSKFELERRGLLRPDGSVRRYEPAGFERFSPDPGFRGGEF